MFHNSACSCVRSVAAYSKWARDSACSYKATLPRLSRLLRAGSLCSMQFGQRVKSVTLAEFKSDEIQAMKDGGNEVGYTTKH